MAKLPSVTSPIPNDLRAFLDRVKEAINGTGPESLVSVRQLVAAGVVQHTGNNITGVGGTGNVSVPSRPQNVQASGALANIMVTWDKPMYNGHAYAEIWAAQQTTAQEADDVAPTLGQAELVGMAPGVFFAHNVGAAAHRWYWVRFVNVNGVVGPYQSTEGIEGETSVDPTYVLEVLTGAITESQLYEDLGDRIDLIDGADTLSGSVAYRIKEEHDSRVSAQATISSAVSSEESARQSEDSAITQQLNVAVSQYQHNAASIATEQTTRASADEAVAQQVSTVASSLGDAFSAIQTEETSRTTEDAALATQVNTLVSQIGTNAAGIQTEATTRTTDDEALAAQVNIVSASTQTSSAAINEEATTRANNYSALAGQISTLSSSIDDAHADIQTEETARANADSAEATARQTLQANLNARELGLPVAQWENLNTGAEKVTITDGVVGSDALKIVPGSTSNQMVTTDNAIPIDDTKTYLVRFWARPSSDCTGRLYFSLRQRTASGWGPTNSGRSPYKPGGKTKAGHDNDYPQVSGNSVFGLYEYEWDSSDWQTGVVAFVPEFLDNYGTNAAGHWHVQGFEIIDKTTIDAAVQVEATARSDAVDGIEAKYTVKVDAGGHLAGYGLIATDNDGTPTSSFGVRADEFFLAPPTTQSATAPASSTRYVGMAWLDTDTDELKYWNGTAWVNDSPSLPFIIRTASTTINGETVDPGVYIADAFVANGTITNAKIGDAAIDNAKIANVNAGKINAGYLSADRIEAGSIDADKIDSRGLSIKDNDGNVILAAGTPLQPSDYVAPTELPSLFYNSNFTRVASDGRPAGVFSCNSSTNKANIEYQDDAKSILAIISGNGTDTTTGGALQAIRVDPTVTYMIYARVKATANKSSGFYMRARELDTELGNDINFIGGTSREAGGVTSTRTKNFSDFGAGSGNFSNVAITNAWVDIIGEYKPTSTAKWMSVEFLNWTGMGTAELHIAHCIIATKQTKITADNVSTYIADASIDLVHIDTATIDDLSAINADMGTITAGKMQSSDGNFVIDLDNKTISIET